MAQRVNQRLLDVTIVLSLNRDVREIRECSSARARAIAKDSTDVILVIIRSIYLTVYRD